MGHLAFGFFRGSDWPEPDAEHDGSYSEKFGSDCLSPRRLSYKRPVFLEQTTRVSHAIPVCPDISCADGGVCPFYGTL